MASISQDAILLLLEVDFFCFSLRYVICDNNTVCQIDNIFFVSL